ncbi:MAG: hypothetical protein GY870_14205 [archaeon]|nr:hypothetical protein [archaeon]
MVEKSEMSEKKVFFLITEPPYTSRKPNKAYAYAKYFIKYGGKPIIFHFMDGIHNLSEGQYALNFPVVNQLVEELINLGAEVGCCSRCLIARGYWDEDKSKLKEKIIVPKNIIDGVAVHSVSKIAKSIKLGYKILKF